MQTGIHAARTISRRLGGKEPTPFRYRDLGSMAVISRRKAIVSFRGLRISGYLGWLMWLVVHLTFMTGFKNRFLTIFYWLFSFIGHGRTERALLPLGEHEPSDATQSGAPPAVLSEPTRSTQ